MCQPPSDMGLRGGCGLRVARRPLLLGLARWENSPWARNGGLPPLTPPACLAHLVGGASCHTSATYLNREVYAMKLPVAYIKEGVEAWLSKVGARENVNL